MELEDRTRRGGDRRKEAFVRAPACTLPVPLPRRRIDERTARAIRTYPCGSPRSFGNARTPGPARNAEGGRLVWPSHFHCLSGVARSADSPHLRGAGHHIDAGKIGRAHV